MDIVERLRLFAKDAPTAIISDNALRRADEIVRLRGYRNKILEEAALNAEGFGGSRNDAKNYWAREISESIRELKEIA